MNVLIAIPARLESTRLPQKLLLAETGKPLIQHTVEAAVATGCRVAVAADEGVYMAACMDKPFWLSRLFHCDGKHENGTSRICELIGQDEFEDDVFDLIINWQADEPEIKPEHIEELIRQATMFPGCDVATLAHCKWPTIDDLRDGSVTKVEVVRGLAARFGRSIGGDRDNIYRHIGIYAYTPHALSWFCGQQPTQNEQRESLEQLRALDSGCRIRVGLVDHPYRGIDTRADYDAFVARQKASQPLDASPAVPQ